MIKQRPSQQSPIKDKVLQATNTFFSYLLPFTSAVPVSLSRNSTKSWHLPARSQESVSYSTFNEHGIDVVIRTPPIPRRKGSWISKPRHERTQSCRRISSRRDWSGELEESEYHLPFPVATEETERGGHGVVQRIVSFQDEKGGLPQLDTSFAGQGLMIDVDSHIVAERVEDEADRMSSSVGTESSSVESLDTFTSVDTYTSVVDSEWTALSQEADGIEMYF